MVYAPTPCDVPAFSPGGPGAPYVLFLSLQPQPGAFGTNLGFGSTCFPVLPAGPAELVLVDTLGLFPALLPGAAARAEAAWEALRTLEARMPLRSDVIERSPRDAELDLFERLGYGGGGE